MTELYISDLDGTLLNSSAQLSEYSKSGVTQIVEAGIDFTVATARSVKSVQPIFHDVELCMPVIEFNGAFISDLRSGMHLVVNAIDRDIYSELLGRFKQWKRNFFISSFDGTKDLLNYQQTSNDGDDWYLQSRIKSKDPRLRQVDSIFDVLNEDIICFTLIDTLKNLDNEYIELQKIPGIELHLQENLYSPGWYWLTVHSEEATKDRAIQTLKEIAGRDSHSVTVFGDNTNDIKMMKAAERAIAVANAKDEVKAVAHEVIGPHTEDSVVKYILAHEKEKIMKMKADEKR